MNVEKASQLNKVLTRDYLDYIPAADSQFAESAGALSYLRLCGLSSFWKEGDRDNRVFLSSVKNVITALSASGFIFAMKAVCFRGRLFIYYGTHPQGEELLQAAITASFPQAVLTACRGQALADDAFPCGGIITGYPAEGVKEHPLLGALENISRGLFDSDWAITFIAEAFPGHLASEAVARMNFAISAVEGMAKETINEGNYTGKSYSLSREYTDQNAITYIQNITRIRDMLLAGRRSGMWNVAGYYTAADGQTAARLANMIVSGFSAGSEMNEPVRCVPMQRVREIVSGNAILTDRYSGFEEHPAGGWHDQNGTYEVFSRKYTTIMNTELFAAFAKPPMVEFPGYFVNKYMDFDSADRTGGDGDQSDRITLGEIVALSNARSNSQNAYTVPLDDLTRHGLIVGITGGGKSNTTKAILKELWLRKRVPFLVIESAKREYINLLNIQGEADENGVLRDFSGLCLFTLGSETAASSIPYRINPFEVVSGASLQTHIDYLLATFKASFELYPPMPYVLEAAVYEVYEDRGWDIAENTNRFGHTLYPTLTDLYFKIDAVTDRLGYHDEIRSNVKAALKARIHSLRIGGKGAMLDTRKSLPVGHLLESPVVLELEDIGDDETKAFVIGILLVQIFEYRKSCGADPLNPLRHVLIVEEAHRLLKKTGGGSAEGPNPAEKAVEFFCNMLAEIRSYGQGIVVADQIPTKLAEDVLKNTNLKIVHRTVMKEDREIVGAAMNMTEEQIGDLASLKRGQAAVYSEGDGRPKLVGFPLVRVSAETSRPVLLDRIRSNVGQFAGIYEKKAVIHCGCTFCDGSCDLIGKMRSAIRQIDKTHYYTKFIHSEKNGLSVAALIRAVEEMGEPLSVRERICCAGEMIREIEDDSEEKQMEQTVMYFRLFGG